MSQYKLIITGAGASAHNGLPLGSELIDAMEYTVNELKTHKIKDAVHLKHAEQFIVDIKFYNPVNIDYFLFLHPAKREIGQRLIETTILRGIKSDVLSMGVSFRKFWKPRTKDKNNFFDPKNWVKFFLQNQLAYCENSQDVISALKSLFLITFNYDVMFELALYKYLKTTLFYNDDLKEYVFKDFFVNNIVHVYGKISCDYENFENLDSRQVCEFFENWSSCDSKISVIGVGKSILHCKAVEMIKSSEDIYFLGYGFDEFNNKTLDLGKVLSEKKINQRIYYTNVADGIKINDTMSSFFGNSVDMVESYRGGSTCGGGTHNATITKSTKTVYDALEHDFIVPIFKIDKN